MSKWYFYWIGMISLMSPFACLGQEEALDTVKVYVIDFGDRQPIDTFLSQEIHRYLDGRTRASIDFDDHGQALYKTYWEWEDTLLVAKRVWRFHDQDSLKVAESEYHKGRLKHKVKYDEKGQPVYRQSWSYRDDGQTAQMSYSDFTTAELIYGYQYQYDQQNRLIRKVLLGRDLKPARPDNFDFEGPFMQEADTIEFHYSRKGLRQKKIRYHYPRRKGHTLTNQTSIYSYAFFKRQIKCSKNWANGQLESIQHFRYRRNGHYLETWRTTAHDIDLERQEYNDKGQVTRALIYQNGHIKRMICYNCSPP